MPFTLALAQSLATFPGLRYGVPLVRFARTIKRRALPQGKLGKPTMNRE